MALPNIVQKIAGILARLGTAEAGISTAQSTANTAKANAQAAQETANRAVSAAAEADGKAVEAKNTADGKAPKDHADATEIYGKGTSTKYGHVKVVDSLGSDPATASSGVAVSPKAVFDAVATGTSGLKVLPLSGGDLTGAVTMPTPVAGKNDKTLATTAWVRCEMLNIVYPVGSIYMSVSNVSPATFLGGTWAPLQGRFLIGADKTYAVNATGGSATHKISAAEMPVHKHAVTVATGGKHTHKRGTLRIQGSITSLDPNEPLTLADKWTASGALTISNVGEPEDVNTKRGYILDSAMKSGGHRNTITIDTNFRSGSGWSGETASAGDHEHTATVGNAGSSAAMSIMPPYLAVYMWKRTN